MQHSDSTAAKGTQIRSAQIRYLLIQPNTAGITDNTGEHWDNVIQAARKTIPDVNNFMFRIDPSV